MKSFLIKLCFEAIDTVYLIFGSILIIVAYVYSSDGIFGIPSSLTAGLIGAGTTFLFLLLPYYFLSKIKKSNRKK